MLHAVRHHRSEPRQRLADCARVDERARFLDPGAEHGVRRRADAQPFRPGGGDNCLAIGDRGGDRFLGIDVLAGFDRLERHRGVGLRNGEIQHDIDVVALEKVVHASRWDRVARGLPACRLGAEIGAGGEDDVAKARRVQEIDVGNIAAADNTDAHGPPRRHHRSPFAYPRIAAALTRTKRSKSLGLSCSAIIISTPAATHCGQSSRPWHGSRSDIGPAVFVLFFARGRDVLDMDKRNATSIPLYPTTRISPAAHHPGEIRFP